MPGKEFIYNQARIKRTGHGGATPFPAAADPHKTGNGDVLRARRHGLAAPDGTWEKTPKPQMQERSRCRQGVPPVCRDFIPRPRLQRFCGPPASNGGGEQGALQA